MKLDKHNKNMWTKVTPFENIHRKRIVDVVFICLFVYLCILLAVVLWRMASMIKSNVVFFSLFFLCVFCLFIFFFSIFFSFLSKNFRVFLFNDFFLVLLKKSVFFFFGFKIDNKSEILPRLEPSHKLATEQRPFQLSFHCQDYLNRRHNYPIHVLIVLSIYEPYLVAILMSIAGVDVLIAFVNVSSYFRHYFVGWYLYW